MLTTTHERDALDELTARRRADHEAAIAESVRERLAAPELVAYLDHEHGPRNGSLDVSVERDDAGCWIVCVTPRGFDRWEPAGELSSLEREARDHAETIASENDWNERRIALSRESGRLAFEARRFRAPVNCDDEAEAAAWLQGYDEAKLDRQNRDRPPIWFAIVAYTYLANPDDRTSRRFDTLRPVFAGSREDAVREAEPIARDIWIGDESEPGNVVDRVEIFPFDQSETQTTSARPIALQRLAELVAESDVETDLDSLRRAGL